MLKKFSESFDVESQFTPGMLIYLVSRKGEIIEGFRISSILVDLVSLDRSPLEGSEKQGFTIEGRKLKPNWCAGRKAFLAAFATKDEALELAQKKQRKN